MLALFLTGDFFLHFPRLLYFSLGSFSYTSPAAFFFVVVVVVVFIWGVSLTHPVLASFLSGDFLLHILCCLIFNLVCFSLTSHSFIFIWGISLKHPMLDWYLSGEFLLHIDYLYRGSFSYTSRTGFFSYLGSFSYTSRADFIFIWGVFLTYPMPFSFLSGEFPLRILHRLFFFFFFFFFFFPSGAFLLRIPRWLHFYLGSFSYTSCAGFFSYLRSFFYASIAGFFSYLGHFSYTSRAGFFSYLRSFSYTSNAGFIYIWGVSLTHPMLALIFCGEKLWHIPRSGFYF